MRRRSFEIDRLHRADELLSGGHVARSRQLAGFRYGDRLNEDISNYGRVSEYNARTIPGPRHFDHRSPAPIHQGKGPRSYRRGDDRIREDICERMTENRYLDASEIEVTVTDAEVTLTGTVGSRYEKRLAEDLADTAYGTTNVANCLRIIEKE